MQIHTMEKGHAKQRNAITIVDFDPTSEGRGEKGRERRENENKQLRHLRVAITRRRGERSPCDTHFVLHVANIYIYNSVKIQPASRYRISLTRKCKLYFAAAAAPVFCRRRIKFRGKNRRFCWIYGQSRLKKAGIHEPRYLSLARLE